MHGHIIVSVESSSEKTSEDFNNKTLAHNKAELQSQDLVDALGKLVETTANNVTSSIKRDSILDTAKETIYKTLLADYTGKEEKKFIVEISDIKQTLSFRPVSYSTNNDSDKTIKSIAIEVTPENIDATIKVFQEAAKEGEKIRSSFDNTYEGREKLGGIIIRNTAEKLASVGR